MNKLKYERTFVYRIDSSDNIVFVDEDWLSFAHENDTHSLTRDTVLNKSLWDFIVNEETRYLYKLIMEKVRTNGELVKVPFRCDSPDCRRFMEMEIFRFEEDFVEFRSRILKLEFRDPVKISDANTGGRSEFEAICGWCKKIRVPEAGWLEIETAISHLDLLGAAKSFQLTHGICPSCHESVMQSLAS